MSDLLLCYSNVFILEKLISPIYIKKSILILDFLYTAANLKTISRQGWIDKLSMANPESVADHIFSMAIIGMILSDSQNYNTGKILKMILIHDLSESITGDFTPEQKPKKEKRILENKAIKKIFKSLPKTLQKQYISIWDEYQKNESEEANFVHQIDKLEMVLQAKIYSKQIGESKKFDIFLDSAKKEIKHPDILNLFNQINN